MHLRFSRAFYVIILTIGTLCALPACSKSSSSAGVTGASPGPTATPTSTVSTTVSATGEVISLPNSLGFPGIAGIPAATTGAGTTLTITGSTTLPTGPPAFPGSGSALYFLTLSDPSTVSFTGFPSLSIQLPSTVSTSNVVFYIALYDPKNASAGWQLAFQGPGTITSTSPTTVAFNAGNLPFTIQAAANDVVALYTVASAGPTPTPPAPTKYIYETNSGASNPSPNTVLLFPATASGNTLPISSISGAATLLSQPNGLAIDNSGTLYVANGGGSITEYATGANGNTAPVRAIAGPSTLLIHPQFDAVDASANVYVSQNTASGGVDSVEVFSAGSNGNVAPVETIAGPATGLASPFGVAVDGSGHIFVANNGNSTVTEYAAGATGNAAPIATISGSSTTLSGPTGIAVDRVGNIYVNNAAGTVDVFPPGSNGNIAPTLAIGGSNTLLNVPMGIALDAFTQIYVANNGATGIGANSIVTFAGQSGNTVPRQFISGPGTQLAQPFGIAAR